MLVLYSVMSELMPLDLSPVAAIAPAIMSAYEARNNKKTKSYASHFCPFIKKANFFQNYSLKFRLCLWPENVHRGTLAAREIGKNDRIVRTSSLRGSQIHHRLKQKQSLSVREGHRLDLGWEPESTRRPPAPHPDLGQ